jgi:hypothetical protein
MSTARGEAGTVDHLLLTKFNVMLRGQSPPLPGLAAGWLEGRLQLFEEWALPSVRRQTRAPLAWLVFVNAQTSPDFLERLERLCRPTATLVPVEGVLTDQRIGEIVQAHLPRRTATLITTRLDSDDALAAGYVETMAAQAASWRGFVNPRSGLQLAGSRVLRCWDRSSPFLSLIEERDPGRAPLTVFCTEHQRAAEVAPVRQLRGRPLWLQVVHGGNLGNEVRGLAYPRALASRALGWRLRKRGSRLELHRLPPALLAQVAHELAGELRRYQRR